ncbi:Zn(II)2Cys6 transcription factor domain-containing protein [Aspergillus lucknowensis]|uniref:Zn(2)-C6 fungal-type domain-containing protein n=1 Tax=Aspergillus lucknowensis TaxID=176173 RepID=A0ABR4LSQ0_9EURO
MQISRRDTRVSSLSPFILMPGALSAMLRRSHKKSRAGCLPCKQRHVKCDERRPICLLCTMSNRDCSYASEAKTPPQASAPSSPSSQPEAIDEEINLKHMELILHMTTNGEMFNLGDSIEPNPPGIGFTLKKGLESPYLLYECLAFSARHLAYLHPERSVALLHQAVTLQTRAVALFNADRLHVDRSNCVAILLFSVVLGHHLLADTLGKRTPDGLDAFLVHYVQCAETLRGVRIVLMAARPLLMETELEPVLSRSIRFTSQDPKGRDCDRIKTLILNTRTLIDGEKTACVRAIQYLQIGFDAIPPTAPDHKMRYQMLFLWAVLVPPDFITLLVARRPEALVILGYYAVLLHYGRHMWQVGDSGLYILGLIEGYLGREWDECLEFPRRCIRELGIDNFNSLAA